MNREENERQHQVLGEVGCAWTLAEHEPNIPSLSVIEKVIEAARVVAGTRADSQSAENLKALRSALDALGEPSHAH